MSPEAFEAMKAKLRRQWEASIVVYQPSVTAKPQDMAMPPSAPPLEWGEIANMENNEAMEAAARRRLFSRRLS